MKRLFILSIIISFVSYNYLIKHVRNELTYTKKIIFNPEQGGWDDPYGAIEFRYNMLKGRKPYLDPRARSRAIKYTKKYLLKKNPNDINTISSWSPLGPGNIGGRIRSILISPKNPNTILIGAVAGGVWKTTDGGAAWLPKTDNGNPIAIGCMANDKDTVYAGTGEGWGNVDAVYGGGIYKSTDFGDTWTLLDSTTSNNPLTAVYWNFRNVLKIAIDRKGNIYAVTKAFNYKDGVGKYYGNGGLYKSSNGGATWRNISKGVTNNFNGSDVIPINPDTILFATQDNGATVGGIFKTTNGGGTWVQSTNGLPSSNYGRISFAQNPQNPNSIFAAFELTNTSKGLSEVVKSTDGGSNWTKLTNPQRIASTGNLSYFGTQGWYNNVITIDPFDSNNIYLGGVDIMKSTNGGKSWAQLTYWDASFGYPAVHADHHAIVFDTTTTGVFYDGNDGGIYKAAGGGSNWTNLNNNLAITQFYGGAVFPTGNTIYGGTQDNGELQFTGSGTNWNQVVGGDGGYTAVDQSNSNIAYEEYTYLQISKTINGGNTWNTSFKGLTDAGVDTLCLFIAPFSLNPENPSVLIAGSNKVWLTTDGADNWNQSGQVLSSGNLISAVTIVDSLSHLLGFAGTTDGRIFKCTNVTGSTGDVWTEVTPTSGNGVQNNGAYVRRIIVNLNNKQDIYACYSGYNDDGVTPTRHILYSTDQGISWKDISGDLPDVPVHSLVIDPNNPQTLYIGTETGVYQTTNGGTNWVNTTTGMPNYAPVDELVRQTGTNKLFAFTHGRSAFQTTTPLPVELENFTADVNKDNVILNWETATEVNNSGFEIQRSPSPALPKGKGEELPLPLEGGQGVGWVKVGFVQGAGNSTTTRKYSFVDVNPSGGTYFSYRIKQIDFNGSYKYSNVINVKIMPAVYALSQNYPNPFNPVTTIKYSLPERSKVVLNVYDLTGSEVASLVNKIETAGLYSVEFNASGFASGVYFYRLTVNNNSIIKKMILLK